jgi:predicted dienelactone hydrolase
MRRVSVIVLACVVFATAVPAQNRIDIVAPTAPELAPYGPHAIGVRTVTVTDRNRPDIINTKPGGPVPRYDRTLALEVWYPATLAPGQKPGGEYRVMLRDPSLTATLTGRAVRDAAPSASGPFPLVVISHGYPGNRYLMSHLGENLASKGYVAVSIDHKDSTYDDQAAFASTLYNRPFDQLFAIDAVAGLDFLKGVVDTSRTGIVGYSMGGYGVVNVIGGGFSAASAAFDTSPPNGMLADRGAANAAYQKARDPRIKAAIAIGPWGMQRGFWDADGLKGIRTPVMFVAGSVDDTSGYEKGVRAIYEGAVNADRYLLTFINANHNAAAPYPAPAESFVTPEAPRTSPFTHYADAVWDTTRMNNILQHFATAYFGVHLKNEADKQTYLDVPPNGKDADWKGFRRRSAVGLILEHAVPAPNAPPEAGQDNAASARRSLIRKWEAKPR